MNACALDFPDDTFDVVMDKGTMDSILCGEGSTTNVGKMLAEVTRVLKPNGVFFMVSYSSPDNRLSYLENDDYHWKVVVHTVGTPPIAPPWPAQQAAPAVASHMCTHHAHTLLSLSLITAKPTVSATAIDTKDSSNVHYVYACCKGSDD